VPYSATPYPPKALELAAPRQSGGTSTSEHLGGRLDISGSVSYANDTFWHKGGGLITDYARSDLQSAKALPSGAKTGPWQGLVQEVGRDYDAFPSLSRSIPSAAFGWT
jgi:hypothetical protein